MASNRKTAEKQNDAPGVADTAPLESASTVEPGVSIVNTSVSVPTVALGEQLANADSPDPHPVAPNEGERPTRGRPKGSGNKTPRRLNPEFPTPATSKTILATLESCRASASAIVDTTTGICASMISVEWRTSIDEREQLIDATTRYMHAKNIPDIPPGALLLLAIGAYIIPRLSMPDTQRLIGELKGKVLGV